MSDAPVMPDIGHNLQPIQKLAHDMTHTGSLWANNLTKGDKHRDVVLVQAFTLRTHMEDPELRIFINGLLTEVKVPTTARSGEFTQLLHLAFHKAKLKPEKSQMSRWAGALQHAWSHDPRPAPDGVPEFIKKQGGDVKCAEKARKADRSRIEQQAIPLPCELPADLLAVFKDGKSPPGRIEQAETGGYQFVWRREKVISSETPPASSPATAEAVTENAA
jgi:hypothetical protein